jgi:prefoldin subunit 5
MTDTESSSTSAAVAIIDQRVEALEERLREVQERIKELRHIREAVIQDLASAPSYGSAKTRRGD